MIHLEEMVQVRWADDEIDRHVEAEVTTAEEVDTAPLATWPEDDWYLDDYRASQLD